MFLQQLKLLHFKNHQQVQLDFSPVANAFVGANGQGKTNLLDAIHYACLTKSYFSVLDKELVKHGEDFFRLDATFELGADDPLRIVAKVKPPRLKEFLANEAPYERMADHIGRIPVTMIAPDDTSLLTEGSEERRKLIDNTLSQTDPAYLRHLMLYNKLLLQRNALLKQSLDGGPLDMSLLEVIGMQMVAPTQYLIESRKAFAQSFVSVFQECYESLCQGAEVVSCSYQSQLLGTSLERLMEERLGRDRALGRTTGGPHRDDLICLLAGKDAKKIASQGQRKSFVLAMRLAQYQWLKASKGQAPLLLLDDIFDKLDGQRVLRLMDLLQAQGCGQVFLTDTHPERAEPLLKRFSESGKLFNVADNSVTVMSL